MKTLNQIDLELEQRRSLLKGNTEIDLDAIEKEITDLTNERSAVVAAIERRHNLLDSIANGELGVEKRSASLARDDIGSDSAEEESDVLATPEYRSAFYKKLTSRALNPKEARAWQQMEQRAGGMTSADDSAGPAIPTVLNDRIIQKVKQIAPMLDEITLMRINGNFKIAVEGTIADAKKHTENAEVTPDADKLVEVVLGGYEIIKLVPISMKTKTMTQSTFEDWIAEMLAKRVARQIEKWCINGTGNDEPKGVAFATTWVEGTNQVTVAKAASLTTENVNTACGLLNGEYDYNAKILMSKKTLFTDFMPLADKSKNDVVRSEGKNYFVNGYPVLLSDSVQLHDAYIGSFTEIYGNLAQDITFAADSSAGFTKGNIMYRGMAIFDCKPAIEEAFVKITKATA